MCASPSEKLIVAGVNNSIVSVQVIKFTTETSINKVLNGFSKICRKNMESNFKLELNCEEQKAIFLELNIQAQELRAEFCFFQHCGAKTN